MISVSIIGGTGYTGQELLRILCNHPKVKVEGIITRSHPGERFSNIYPSLKGLVDAECSEFESRGFIDRSDVVFIALPHGLTAPFAAEASRKGKKVVDLGADFRFNSPQTYQQWYSSRHPHPELLERAVYGIPEINRDRIKDTAIVANPGCYPTCSILTIAPLLKEDVIDEHSIIIDAKSGISGAGRELRLGSLFCEADENIKAYGVAGHRHQPEIEEQLTFIAGKEVRVSFTPHLVPMSRGIMVTAYGNLKREADMDMLFEMYREFYSGEYFVRVMEKGKMPETRQVRASNFCDIGIAVDRHTNRVIACGVIDNLVKGASGQAVQNMNILCGLPESTGLDIPPVYI